MIHISRHTQVNIGIHERVVLDRSGKRGRSFGSFIFRWRTPRYIRLPWFWVTLFLRYVDAHYFGYMDEEDGQVMPLEAEAEKRAREEAIDNYKMDKELAAMKNSDDWDKGSC